MANRIENIWICGDGSIRVHYVHEGKRYSSDREMLFTLDEITRGWDVVRCRAKYLDSKGMQKVRMYVGYVNELQNESI